MVMEIANKEPATEVTLSYFALGTEAHWLLRNQSVSQKPHQDGNMVDEDPNNRKILIDMMKTAFNGEVNDIYMRNLPPCIAYKMMVRTLANF